MANLVMASCSFAGPAHGVQPEELLLFAPAGGHPGAPGGPVAYAFQPGSARCSTGWPSSPAAEHVPRPAAGQEPPAPGLPLVAPTHPDSYNTCREALEENAPRRYSARHSTRPIAPSGGSGISSPS